MPDLRSEAGVCVLSSTTPCGICVEASEGRPGLSLLHLQTQYGLSDLYLECTYLPSVTSGPSSVAVSPCGSWLAFSMAGSLWLMPAEGGRARQVTSPRAAYDSQPHWHPSGARLAFTRDDGRTIEIWEVDAHTLTERRVTTHGAVSTDPKWSPDGAKLAYCSNADSNAFRILVKADDATSTHAPLVAIDHAPFHALAPEWLDDSSLVYQSNHPIDGNRSYGAGYLHVASLSAADVHSRLLIRDELFHYARPRASTKGVVAYLGQQRGLPEIRLCHRRHGNPYSLRYALFDEPTAIAWAPAGDRIVAVATRVVDGAVGIFSISLNDGDCSELTITEYSRRTPHGTLRVRVVDDVSGREMAARLYVTAADQRSYSPHGAIHRQSLSTGDHYTYTPGTSTLELPVGPVQIEARCGFEFRPASVSLTVEDGRIASVTLRLARISSMDDWRTGDTHVHHRYGGSLGRSLERMELESRAEGLHFPNLLVANRDNVVLDGDLASTSALELTQSAIRGQEYRPMFAGHVGLLGVAEYRLPPFAGYRGTAFASDYPSNCDVVLAARARGALCGYVHPFYLSDADPESYDYRGARELPVTAAVVGLDYYEVLCIWSYESASANVWYRLLNVGLKIPAAAGSDCFLDFWRTPALGGVRTYVRHGGPSARDWLDGLRAGRSFVTNGPLVELSVDGVSPGGTVTLQGPQSAGFTVAVSSIVPWTRLDVVVNGRVEATLVPQGGERVEWRGRIELKYDGWVAARVVGPRNEHGVMDTDVFAHTSPIYVVTGTADPGKAQDARYFERWCARGLELLVSEAVFSDDAERMTVERRWHQAQEFYRALAS